MCAEVLQHRQYHLTGGPGNRRASRHVRMACCGMSAAFSMTTKRTLGHDTVARNVDYVQENVVSFRLVSIIIEARIGSLSCLI